MSKFRIDQARANEALDRILLASRTGQGPFQVYQLPQEVRNYPSNLKGDLGIGRYLFVNLLHQANYESELGFRGHKKLHEQFPEIYDPAEALRFTADEIREMMKSVGLPLYEKDRPGKRGGKRPEWLLHNAMVLNTPFIGDDPRNIFQGLPEDPLEVWSVLIGRVAMRNSPWKLMGIQEKMLAYFIHLFVDAGLIAPIDAPGVIDVQQNRFWGCLDLVRHRPTVGSYKELNFFRDQIRRGYIAYAQAAGVPMLEIGEAVWYYAREMCKVAPSPYAADGSGRRLSLSEFQVASERPRGNRRSYAETCGSCIVSDLCNWYMPSDAYYGRGEHTGGLLFVPRPKPPGEQPSPLDSQKPRVKRCTRHQGHYWDPDPTVGCIGCGGCGQRLILPDRLARGSNSKSASNK